MKIVQVHIDRATVGDVQYLFQFLEEHIGEEGIDWQKREEQCLPTETRFSIATGAEHIETVREICQRPRFRCEEA